MKIIVFHRKQTQEQKEVIDSSSQEQSPNEKNPYARLKKSKRLGLTDFKYSLRNTSNSVVIGIEVLENGRQSTKGSVSVPIKPWSCYNIFFRPHTRKFAVIDRTILNSVTTNVIYNTENYVGRVVTTDSETLLYLRGAIPNISGYKNIVVGDDQTSASAFARYSSKVQQFIGKIEKKQESLAQIDDPSRLAYLEAQVDVLTKIILDSKLAKDKGLNSLLENALSLSSLANKSNAEISKRIQYKKVVQSLKVV